MKTFFLLTFFFLIGFKSYAQTSSCDCADRIGQLINYYYDKENYAAALAATEEVIRQKNEFASHSNYTVLAYLYADNDRLDDVVPAFLEAAERGMPREKLTSDKVQEIRKKIGEERWQER